MGTPDDGIRIKSSEDRWNALGCSVKLLSEVCEIEHDKGVSENSSNAQISREFERVFIQLYLCA